MKRFALMMTAAVAVITHSSCSKTTDEITTDGAVEWRHYGGSEAATKFSPLSQINRSNVTSLRVAWKQRTQDSLYEHGIAGRDIRFETTPLMIFGTLYVVSPVNRVHALDPETGKVRWVFDPRVDRDKRYAEAFTARGVAAWTDRAVSDLPCTRRIFVATIDARLVAIDAMTGNLCSTFGNRGMLDLRARAALNGSTVDPADYSVTSPPAVVRDVVVVGSAIKKSVGPTAPSGQVRGFDARTGALRWSFDAIPRSAKHPAWASWTAATAQRTGGANAWAPITGDSEADLVFLPTASAAPDFYGGARPGDNAFANSIVALKASTGALVWSFQTVHHDLWDYDIAAQPILITVRRHGKDVKAVVAGTKSGMIFVLERNTGKPLFEVAERAVPQSDVVGETSSPTQPFPATLPMVHGTTLTADSAFGVTDADREFCRDWISRLRNEGIFTPPSIQGTLVWPGFWGGLNWDGLAWDAERQLLVMTVKRMAMVVQLRHNDQAIRDSDARHPGLQVVPQAGTSFSAARMPLVAPSGVPCTPPPWGSLIALSLADSSILWNRTLGKVPGVGRPAESGKWGSIVFGGPLITAGGLVFIGASQDDRFRAFDVANGRTLWEFELPAGGQASPMTYRINGQQYVVVVAGGRAGIGSHGDWIVAFALPPIRSSPGTAVMHD